MHTDAQVQSILSPRGPAAAILSRLGVTLTLIAVAVTIVMTLLILLPLRRRPSADLAGNAPLDRFHTTDRRGVRWIHAGTVLATAILVFSAVYSIRVLAAYSTEEATSTMTVRITGYQYWWKVEYLDQDGRTTLRDANELHLPAATRVRLLLNAADVIHSFWIPGLAGKTDLIPGRPTAMWIEADRPGEYRGQCAEYCGMAHANMRLDLVADDSAGFAAWRDREARVPPVDSGAAQILQRHGCAACHSLAGQMSGAAGPDLTHLASRATLGAGVLANNVANLRAWLLDPQAIKPGALMPATGLTAAEVDQLVAYLRTLQ